MTVRKNIKGKNIFNLNQNFDEMDVENYSNINNKEDFKINFVMKKII